MEVDIPPEIDMQIATLIEEGEFESEEDAIRHLLKAGVRAYQTDNVTDEPLDQSPTTTHDDEYIF